MTEEAAESPVNEAFSPESERETLALLARRTLPRSYHWLYRRSSNLTKVHLPSAIDRLCDDGVVSSLGNGTWERRAELEEKTATGKAVLSLDGRDFEWANALAEYLEQKGMPVQRHCTVCGFTLALTLTDSTARLDVEIDGRRHRILPSQRAKEIVRDKRLKANGWSVLRLDIAEAVASAVMSGEKVIRVWKKVKGGGSIE